MKRIINGKTYDTDTAELVASGDNGCDVGDCWRRNEELYRTKKGAYFIYDSTPKIITVNEEGFLSVDHYHAEHTTIFEWLEEWNVSILETREIEFFGITEA